MTKRLSLQQACECPFCGKHYRGKMYLVVGVDEDPQA